MAITLTVADLSNAVRLGDSAEENAESARLLAYTTAAITQHLGDSYADAPEVVVNEAAIRLAGYLFDQPNAGRGLSYANAGRNSGAWAILLPFRVHRAGSTDDAVAAAQEAVGTAVNPVIDVSVDAVAGTITVSFADGTTRTDALPAGMGGGVLDQTARDAASGAQSEIDAHELTLHNTDTVARSTAVNARQIGEAAQATADALRTELTTHEGTPHGGGGGADQTARDAAADAQVAADTAQSGLDAHEGSTHNHDQIARDAAATAQGAAATAQGAIDAHEGSTHNTDTIARDAAADAQSAIADHERAPHNTDGPARTAASAAQARADDAYTLADGKVDSSGATSAAREVTADWAEDENTDPIPAPKLANVVTAHVDIANVLDGRLPGLPVVMRLGWSQSRMFTELDFDRPLPPIGGSIAGMSGGLAAPPFPPGLASDPTLYLGIWLAGDPDVAELPAGFAVADKSAITVDGAAGVYFASTERLPASVAGDVFKVFLVGPRIVTESDLAAHTSDPDAHHIPPAGGGGGESAGLEVSTAEIRFLRSTPLVEIDSQQFTSTAWSNLQRDGADLVCPTTGQLEVFMYAKTGGRDNSVAFAKIPASELRATPTNGEMQLALGANRWFGIRTNSLADQQIQVKGQDGQTSVNGNYAVRISHIEEVTATVVTQVTVGGGGA